MGENFRLLLAGDTSFGENYQVEREAAGHENVVSARGRAHSLARVIPLLQSADYVIANLETPLTRTAVSPFEGRKSFIHWSDPDASPEALRQHGVDAVSLANNHVMDYGPEALFETLEALDRHGIRRFGAGRDAAEARQPLFLDVAAGGVARRIAVLGAMEYASHHKRRYGLYAKGETPGTHRLNDDRIAAQITALKREDPSAFVVLFPHWGQNYFWRFPEQERLARVMAEAGADLIIGHGSHMLGEIEQIGRTLVVYSIGNFVFNAPGRYREFGVSPYSLVVRLDIGAASRLRLYPILSDNEATHYQPRPVIEAEAHEVAALLRERSPPMPLQWLEPHRDDSGWYLEIPCSGEGS